MHGVAIYKVEGRIRKGAICVVKGASIHAMGVHDKPVEDDDAVLLAAEGMHPGDRCFIIGDRVRRVREAAS